MHQWPELTEVRNMGGRRAAELSQPAKSDAKENPPCPKCSISSNKPNLSFKSLRSVPRSIFAVFRYGIVDIDLGNVEICRVSPPIKRNFVLMYSRGRRQPSWITSDTERTDCPHPHPRADCAVPVSPVNPVSSRLTDRRAALLPTN